MSVVRWQPALVVDIFFIFFLLLDTFVDGCIYENVINRHYRERQGHLEERKAELDSYERPTNGFSRPFIIKRKEKRQIKDAFKKISCSLVYFSPRFFLLK